MVICIVNCSGDFYDTFLSCMTFHFGKCQARKAMALKSENDLLKLAGGGIQHHPFNDCEFSWHENHKKESIAAKMQV